MLCLGLNPKPQVCLLLFRDLPLLNDAATVNASFNALPKEANGFPANQTLKDFIAANFGAAGSDFESAVPDDFSSDPENFLPNVTDPAIRQWALQVNGLWQDLCREVMLAYVQSPAVGESGGSGQGDHGGDRGGWGEGGNACAESHMLFLGLGTWG